jgi:hypothetical protein
MCFIEVFFAVSTRGAKYFLTSEFWGGRCKKSISMFCNAGKKVSTFIKSNFILLTLKLESFSLPKSSHLTPA